VKILRLDDPLRPGFGRNRDQTQNVVVEIRRDRAESPPETTSEIVTEHNFSKENT
jgi:hypothetical protein